MKYQNKSNGVIAELVQENTKFKTVDLLKENGTQTTISQSTFKRWWTPIPEEETIEEQEKEEASKYVEASQSLTKELNKNNTKSLKEMVDAQADDVAGDGTSLEEVGKEIAEQAKQKAKKAKSGKKKTYTDIKALIDHVNACVEFVGGTHKQSGTSDTRIKYTLPGVNQIAFYVTIQKNSIKFHIRSKMVSKKIQAKCVRVNLSFDCRYKIEELNDETQHFIDELIDDILENRKKEEN